MNKCLFEEENENEKWEEIFELVEKTITECQDEVIRSKREAVQLKQMIEQPTVLKPEVPLIRVSAGLYHNEWSVSLQ